MAVPEPHPVRRRREAGRRVRATTAWSAATGGLLAAAFGVLFAEVPPAAAATVPSPAAATLPAPVSPPAATRHHAPRSAAPRPAPAPRLSSSGSRPHASTGAS